MSVASLRRTRLGLTVIGALLASLSLTGTALADDYAGKRGNCDETAFKSPKTTDPDIVARCVRLWQAYRALQETEAEERDQVILAMKVVYVLGNDRDAHMALTGLKRLRVRDIPERQRSEPVKTVAKSDKKEAPKIARKKCDISDGDRKAADKHFAKGLKAYKAKDIEGAQAHYQKMVDAAPGYPKARFNLAAMYALQEDADAAVEQLYCLQDIGTDEAAAALRSARKDPDFLPIRDKSARFKEVTGYCKIKVGNSLGDQGEDNVDNLEASLTKLGYEVHTRKDAPKRYSYPMLWYKEHNKTQAYLFLKVMGHKGTKVAPIDWKDEDFDIIIAWGDDLKPGDEPPTHIPDPDDAEKSLTNLQRQESEMLRKPDEYTRKVDHTLGAPERAANQAERIGDKAEDVMNAPEKVEKKVDDIKKIGDKLPF